MGKWFPNIDSPCWVEQVFALIPMRMSDGTWVWLKSYYAVVGLFPFVDMCEYKDTIYRSSDGRSANRKCDETNEWKVKQ